MRFWGKSKYGDKKTSREKLICGADSLDGEYGDTGPLLGEGVLSKSKFQGLSHYNRVDAEILFFFFVIESSFDLH